jgi:hypothetical protein
VLDEVFYEMLRKHPVPLREAALRELADRSASLDLYIWLAYRLHVLCGPLAVTWPALHGQFGEGTRKSGFSGETSWPTPIGWSGWNVSA